MIPDLIGGLVLSFLVLLIVGGLTGRVRLQHCCGIADPTRDRRMAAVDPHRDTDADPRGQGSEEVTSPVILGDH